MVYILEITFIFTIEHFLQLLVDQFLIMETMTPLDFMDFRYGQINFKRSYESYEILINSRYKFNDSFLMISTIFMMKVLGIMK